MNDHLPDDRLVALASQWAMMPHSDSVVVFKYDCRDVTAGECRTIVAFNKELTDIRARLQTAEQQLADTQKEFGRIQGTSAKQVVDRFLDLMRKINEKDLPAGFESWEAFLKHIDGISRRAVLAEQQLGQVREEVKDAKLILERVSKRGACEAFNTQGVFRGCQVFRENGKLRCVRCEALSFLQRTATPSDGCGKGRTDKELTLDERLRLPCRHCGGGRASHVGQALACFGGMGTCWTPNEEAASSSGEE